MLREVAYFLTNSQGVLGAVQPADHGAAFTGGDVAGQNFHQGTLPCSIRSEESDDLAFRKIQGDMVQGLLGAVVFGQCMRGNGHRLSLAKKDDPRSPAAGRLERRGRFCPIAVAFQVKGVGEIAFIPAQKQDALVFEGMVRFDQIVNHRDGPEENASKEIVPVTSAKARVVVGTQACIDVIHGLGFIQSDEGEVRGGNAVTLSLVFKNEVLGGHADNVSLKTEPTLEHDEVFGAE